MSCFDTIVAKNIECPVTKKKQNIAIQIKWAGSLMDTYFKGDNLEVLENMSNVWIAEKYFCSACESLADKKYPGWREPITSPKKIFGITIFKEVVGYRYGPSPNKQPDSEEYCHPVYINLQKGKLAEIISESEFKKRGLENYLTGSDLRTE